MNYIEKVQLIYENLISNLDRLLDSYNHDLNKYDYRDSLATYINLYLQKGINLFSRELENIDLYRDRYLSSIKEFPTNKDYDIYTTILYRSKLFLNILLNIDSYYDLYLNNASIVCDYIDSIAQQLYLNDIQYKINSINNEVMTNAINIWTKLVGNVDRCDRCDRCPANEFIARLLEHFPNIKIENLPWQMLTLHTNYLYLAHVYLFTWCFGDLLDKVNIHRYISYVESGLITEEESRYSLVELLLKDKLNKAYLTLNIPETTTSNDYLTIVYRNATTEDIYSADINCNYNKIENKVNYTVIDNNGQTISTTNLLELAHRLIIS